MAGTGTGLGVALMLDPIGTVTGGSAQGIHVVNPATGTYGYQWGTGSSWTGDPIDMDVNDESRRIAMGGGQGNINNIVKLFNMDTGAQVWSAISNGNTQGVTFFKGYNASPMIYCGFHDNNAELTPGSNLPASPYLLGYYVRNLSGTVQSWHPQFPSGGTGTWGVSSQNCWRTWPDEAGKRIFVLGDFNRVNNSSGGGGSAQNAIRIACFDQNSNGTWPEAPTDMLKLGATWFVDATTKEAGRPLWMAKYGGYYYVVGNGFDRVRNKAGTEFTCDSLIRFSTTTLDFDQSFTPAMDPAATSLVIWECAVYGSELIIVGNMTNVMGSARSGIAAINMSTSGLSSRFAGWTVSGGTIQSCDLDGDILYISGTFTSVNDGSGAATRNRAAAIDLTTNTLMSWNPNSSVRVRRIKVVDRQGGGGGGDVTNPSTPTNVSATAVSSSQVNVTWTASTDNVGVDHYTVWRNSTQVGSTAATSYSDTTVAASTSYSYQVRAHDAAGNQSGLSTASNVTTPGGGGGGGGDSVWIMAAGDIAADGQTTASAPQAGTGRILDAWMDADGTANATHTPLYIIPNGDVAYTSNSAAQLNNDFNPFWGTGTTLSGYTWKNKKPLLWAVAGNHEYRLEANSTFRSTVSPDWDAYFGARAFSSADHHWSQSVQAPDGNSYWRIIAIDVAPQSLGRASGGAGGVNMTQAEWDRYTLSQRTFLTAQMDASLTGGPNGGNQHLLIVFHEPLWSAGGYTGVTAVRSVIDIIQNTKYNGVLRVVLNGHDHCYVRYDPLRAGTNNAQTPSTLTAGFVEIVSGAGGGAPDAIAGNTTNVAFSKGGTGIFGISRFELKADRLNGEWVQSNGSTGTVQDTFVLGPVTLSGGTSDTTAPTTPTLSSPSKTDVSVSLSWTASTDASGIASYQIERKTGAGAYSQIASQAGTTLTNSGLTASTSYTYRVRATDASANANQSAYSNEVAVTTNNAPDTTAPSVPTNLRVTSKTDIIVNLAWNASTDNVAVDHYELQRGGVTIVSPTGLTFSDTGRTQNTTYSYTVRAVDTSNNPSAYSSPLSVTTDVTPTDSTPPSVPASLRSTATSTSSISMAWNASTDNVAVDHYELQRDGVTVVTQAGLTFNDAGLASSTTYAYQVRAFDTSNNPSAYSSVVNVTTAAVAGGLINSFENGLGNGAAITTGNSGYSGGNALDYAPADLTTSTDAIFTSGSRSAKSHLPATTTTNIKRGFGYNINPTGGGAMSVTASAKFGIPLGTNVYAPIITAYNARSTSRVLWRVLSTGAGKIEIRDRHNVIKALSSTILPKNSRARVEVVANISDVGVAQNSIIVKIFRSPNGTTPDEILTQNGLSIGNPKDKIHHILFGQTMASAVATDVYFDEVRADWGATAADPLIDDPFTRTGVSSLGTEPVSGLSYTNVYGTWGIEGSAQAKPLTVASGASGTGFAQNVIDLGAALTFPYTIECDITLSNTTNRINAGLCFHATTSSAGGQWLCMIEQTHWVTSGTFQLGYGYGSLEPFATSGAPNLAFVPGSTYHIAIVVDTDTVSASVTGPGVNRTITSPKDATNQSTFNSRAGCGLRVEYGTGDQDDLGSRWDNFKVTPGSGGNPVNAPIISGFSPSQGIVGDLVTITGQYFTGALSVTFNGIPAIGFTVVSDTTITANVPAGGEGYIEVTTADGFDTSGSIFLLPENITPPLVEFFDPTTGPIATPVTITGTNFSGTSSVTFNGTPASFTVVSDTSITTTVPAGATDGLIRVTNQDGYDDSSVSFDVTSTGDTTAPTVPTNFISTGKTSASIDFSWTASTDAVGVDHYEIQRNGGATPVGFPTTTTFTDTGLASSTTYTYAIRAVDAAGNASNYTSPVISVTTSSGGGGTVGADVSANGANGTSVSVSAPTGVTTGKTLLASVALVGANSMAVNGVPSGWSAVPSGADGVGTGASTKVWQGLYTKTAGSGDAGAGFSWTGASGTKSIYVQIASLSVGASLGTPAIVKSSSTSSMDINGTGGSVTSAPEDLILTFNATDWGPRPWPNSGEGVLLGMMPDESTGGPKLSNTAGVNRIEGIIQREIGLSHGGYPDTAQDLGVQATFPEAPGSSTGVTGDFEAGRLSYMSWPRQQGWLHVTGDQPDTAPHTEHTAIASGTYDGVIGQWAAKLKAWGQPCLFRVEWEMNGGDPPWAWGHETMNSTNINLFKTNFIAAWKRIWTILKGTQAQINALSPAYTANGGTAVHAENLFFIWNVMPREASALPSNLGNRDDLWPGASFVDLAAVELYLNPNPTIADTMTDQVGGHKPFYATYAAATGQGKLLAAGEGGNRWQGSADTTACINRTNSFIPGFKAYPNNVIYCWWSGGSTGSYGQSGWSGTTKPPELLAAERAFFKDAYMFPKLTRTINESTGEWAIKTQGRVPMGKAYVNYGPNMLSGAILTHGGSGGSIANAPIQGYGYGRFVTTTIVATSGTAPTIYPPSVDSFTPLTGPTGTQVTVTGTNLDTVTSVRVGGFSASFTHDPVTPATKLSLFVPSNAISGVISATNQDGTRSSSDSFIVTNPPVDPGRVGNGVLPTIPQETVKVGATWYDTSIAGTEMAGRVQSACYAGGYIYVVTQGADRLKRLNTANITISSLFRINALTYEVDPSWLPTFNLTSTASALNLTSVTTDGNTVWVAGNFDSVTINSAIYTRSKIAAFDASTGVPTSWNPPAINGGVKGVVYDAGHLYSVGDFTTVGSGSSGSIPAAVVAAYNFEDITTNSTTVADVTGKGHTGTLVRFSTPPAFPSVVPGPVDTDTVTHGVGLDFDSSQQSQIRIMSTDFDLTTSFTAGAWVYLVDDGLVDRWEVFEKGGAFWLNVRGDTSPKFKVRMGGFIGTGNGTIWNADSASSIPLATWTHLVMTVSSGGVAKLFIDGTLEATYNFASTVLTTQVTEPLVIGAKGRERTPVANEAWWNGWLDDVFVRNDFISNNADIPALSLNWTAATTGATVRNRAACFSSSTAALESWNPDVSGTTNSVAAFTNTGTGQKQIVMSHDSPSTLGVSSPYILSVVQAMDQSSPGALVWGADENTTGASSISDAFTRTSASSLGSTTSGHPWTTGTGTWGTTGTKGYLATKSNGVLNEAWVDSITLTQTVSATITTATTASRTRGGLLARGIDANNYLYVELNSATNTIDLRKKIDGVSTTLASEAYPGGGVTYNGVISDIPTDLPKVGATWHTSAGGAQVPPTSAKNSGRVYQAIQAGGYIYITTWSADRIAELTSSAQTTINSVFRLNATTLDFDPSWIPNFDTPAAYTGGTDARAAATDGTYVYIGGNWAQASDGGALAAHSKVVRYNASTGSMSSWNPGTINGDLYCMVADPANDALYIGGNFTTVNGTARNRLAAVSLSTGALLTWNPNRGSPNPTDITLFNRATGGKRLWVSFDGPGTIGGSGTYVAALIHGIGSTNGTAGNLDWGATAAALAADGVDNNGGGHRVASHDGQQLLAYGTKGDAGDITWMFSVPAGTGSPTNKYGGTNVLSTDGDIQGMCFYDLGTGETIFIHGTHDQSFWSVPKPNATPNSGYENGSAFAAYTISNGALKDTPRPQFVATDAGSPWTSGFQKIWSIKAIAPGRLFVGGNFTRVNRSPANGGATTSPDPKRMALFLEGSTGGTGGSFLNNTDYDVSLSVSGSDVTVNVDQAGTNIAHFTYALTSAESTALSGTYVGIVAQPDASTDEIGGSTGTRWDDFYATSGAVGGSVGGSVCAANNQLQRIALGTAGPASSGGKAVYVYNSTGTKQYSSGKIDTNADIQELAFYQGGSTTPMLYVGTGGTDFETTPSSNTFISHSGLGRYTVSTGILDTSWMPYFNQGVQADPYDGGTGGVWTIAPLEDLDTLLIGGDFTAVNQTNETVVSPSPTRVSLWVEPLDTGPTDPKYTYYLTPPYCGGGYQSITVDPNNAGVLWAGSDVGGIRKTTDRGVTWSLFNRGLYDVESKRKIATIVAADAPVNTTDATWVMAGFGQNGNVGTGLSRDGNDWERQGASVNFNMHNGSAIVSKPRTTGALIAMDPAGDGIQYEASYGDGIYRSTDGGSSATVIAGGVGLYPRCLYLDPADPTKLYFGVYETPEFSGGLYRIDNPQTGINKTMTRIATGAFDIRNVEDIAFAGTNIYVAAAPVVDPAGTSPGDVGTTLLGDSGVFRTNGSSTWENITNGALSSGVEWPYSIGAVNESGSHVVIVGITEGLQIGTTGYFNNLKRSTNGQTTAGSVSWTGVSAAANITDTDNPGNDTFNKQRLGREKCVPAQIIPDPHTSGASLRDWYLMCSEGGIFYYSSDGGQNWLQRTIGFSIWSNNSATIDPTRAGWIIGGNQDNDGWYSPDYMETVVTRAIPSGATSVTTSHDQDCDRTGRYWTVDNDANPSNNRGFIGTGIPSGTSLGYTAVYQGDMLVAIKTGNNASGNVRLITYRNGDVSGNRGFWYTDTPNSGTSLTTQISGWVRASGTPSELILMGLATPNLPLVWPKRDTQSCLYAVIRGSAASSGYWRSTNYGATWTQMYSDTNNNGPREGFIAAHDQGTVYYTNGLGELWRIQNANGSYSRTQLTNVSNAAALNFDSDGTLYVYCNPVQGVYPKLLRCKNPATTGQLSWVDLADPIGGLANDDELQHLLQVNYLLADPSRVWLIINGASALRGVS